MPTDAFHIEYATPMLKASVSTADTTAFMKGLKAALLAATWSLVDAYYATGEMLLPNVPVVVEPIPPVTKVDVTCPKGQIVIGGVGICGYDPYRQNPVSGHFYAYGTSTNATLANIATQITAFTAFDATPVYPGTGSDDLHKWGGVTLIAKVGGPDANNTPNFVSTGFSTLGGFGTSASIKGGGYRLRSGLANGQTQWDIAMADTLRASTPHVTFTVIANGGSSQTILSTGPPVLDVGQPYVCIACPYQFAMVLPGRGDWLFSPRNDISMFQVAPWVPEALRVVNGGPVSYCLLYMAAPPPTSDPGGTNAQFRDRLDWWNNIGVAYNTAALVFSSDNYISDAGPLMLRYAGSLQDTEGEPVVQNAYLSLAPYKGASALVVGKIWNALLISETYALDSEMQFDGHYWYCVSNQATSGYTKGSLWLAFAEVPA